MVPDEVRREAWLPALLAGFDRHAERCADPREAAALAEFPPFVRAHPDCLWRTCLVGHLTASAWIVDSRRTRTLLTHHRKLDRWLQLGGHVDGDPDLARVTELTEEESVLRMVRKTRGG